MVRTDLDAAPRRSRWARTRRPGPAPDLTVHGLVGLVALAIAAPLLLSDFNLSLLAGFLPLVVLAVAVDLLWGENRVVSFGHAAFFAVGAYTGALLLSGPGSTSSDPLGILAESSGPSRLESLISALSGPNVLGVPVFALLLPPVVTGLLGLLIGLIVFRIGSAEIYIPLVTLGVGVVLSTGLADIALVGGTNGLSGVPAFLDKSPTQSRFAEYGFNLIAVSLVYAGYWWFRRSRSGRMWRGLGDEPLRLEAMGYPVLTMRAYGFAASTALAGLAGALYVGSAGFIGPGQAGVAMSAQALIWVAVGGPGNFLGPLVGVLAVSFGAQSLSARFPDLWPLLLGTALITVVLFLPRGLPGLPGQLLALTRRGSTRRRSAKEVDSHASDPT